MSARRLSLLIPAVMVVLAGSLLLCGSLAVASTYVPLTSFAPPGGFDEPVGVAVDSSESPDKGDVYVADRAKNVIYEFSTTGNLLAQANVPEAEIDGLMINNNVRHRSEATEGDLYVVGRRSGTIYRFSPGLGSREEFITGLTRPTGITVNEGEDYLLVSEEDGKVLQFTVEGEPFNPRTYKVVSVGENTVVEGLDDPHTLGGRGERFINGSYTGVNQFFVATNTGTYAYDWTTPFASTSELAAPDGGEATGIATDLAEDIYVDEPGPGGRMEIGEYEIDAAGNVSLVSTFGFGTLSTNAYGLDVSSESGDIYVADAGHKDVSVFAPEDVSVSAATRSATVSIEINPKGQQTSYYVEYGPSIPYQSKTAEASVGLGESPVTTVVHLVGLVPGTQYHMRLVTVSGIGIKTGGDITFTTYASGVSGLPDGRVYELVSQFGMANSEADWPVTSPDGSIASELPFEASENGNVLTYAGMPDLGGSGKGFTQGNEFLASRSPNGGWSQVNISPLSDERGLYEAFTPSLGAGVARFEKILPPFVESERLIEPATGEEHAGVNYFSMLYARGFGEANYRPLFSKVPQYRTGNADGQNVFGVVAVGMSVDGTHTLFQANDSLLEGDGELETELDNDVAKEAKESKEVAALSAERDALYIKSVEDEERGENEEAQHLKERAESISKQITKLESEYIDNRNELYVSVDSRPSLVNVLPDGSVSPGAVFGGGSHDVSSNGSRIFWTSIEDFVHNYSSEHVIEGRPKNIYVREDGSSTVQVSPGPAEFWTASNDGKYAFYTEAGKLWRFDVENSERVELAGSGAGVQSVIGTNETGVDGAYVYFVAHEVLSEREDAAKQKAVEGENNMYVYEPDPERPGQSEIMFIGRQPDSKLSNAYLTPDGHALVFSSHTNLTTTTYPDEGAEEVYVYDANDSSLFCASCRAQASGGNLASGHRWVSEDGSRVFFNSNAPLVPGDVNGTEDVYEWERDGSGTCTEAEGCVYLLSAGIEGAAGLVDASTSGNDVFIVTRQRLIPEDQNEKVEIYDARVDGTLTAAPPQCSGTGCQGAPAPAPIFATPASVTFTGVGNFPPPAPVTKRATSKALTKAQKLSNALKGCRKKHRSKARAVCEAKAQKLYGVKTKTKGAVKREAK